MFGFFVVVFLLAAIAGGMYLFLKHPTQEQIDRYRRHHGEVPVGPKRITGLVALSLSGLAGLLLLMSSLTIVPANNVGVVTNFGTWGGTAHSGINWVAPWSSIDTFPTRNQKSIRDIGTEGEAYCVQTKFAGSASACLDLTVLYTIDEDRAEVLWRGWGNFSKLNKDLIERATDDAVSSVLGFYQAEEYTTKRQEIVEKVNTALRNLLAPQGVKLESVTLGTAHLPKEVQDRINSILAADAKVEVAKREEAAATAEAKANQARQQSLTPEALVKACLDAAKEIKPQYFDCGLGSPTGNKPSVILGNR